MWSSGDVSGYGDRRTWGYRIREPPYVFLAKKNLPPFVLKKTLPTPAITMGDCQLSHSCGDYEVDLSMR